MRTTVTLDDDVAAAVEQLRQANSLGLSAVVNDLIRQGLAVRPGHPPFRQTATRLGLRIDVSNVADAIDLLEGPAAR